MKLNLKNTWKNNFFRGGVIFTFASFLTSILNYFFNLLAARGLGPSGFSEITTLFSYTVIFSVPISVMTFVIIQKIASKGTEKKQYAVALEHWFFEKMKHWWIFVLLSLLLAIFVPNITNLSTLSGYALIPFIIMTFISSFYGAILQGLGFLGWFSLIGIVTVSIKLLGALFVIMHVDTIGTILFFLLISIVFSLISSHVILSKQIVQHKNNFQKINKRIIHSIMNKYVITTFLSVLSITLFSNVDIIFVKKFFPSSSAGIYSAWSLFAKVISYGVGPIIAVSYIFFSSKEEKSLHEKILHVSLIILVFIGIVSFCVYKYYANTIILLLFGVQFLSVKQYLVDASLFGSLYTMITFLNTYFLAKKRFSSLILTVCIPIYLILIFIIPRTLGNLIHLNIVFSLLMTVVYLIAYIHPFFYNFTDGKKKRTSSLP